MIARVMSWLTLSAYQTFLDAPDKPRACPQTCPCFLVTCFRQRLSSITLQAWQLQGPQLRLHTNSQVLRCWKPVAV